MQFGFCLIESMAAKTWRFSLVTFIHHLLVGYCIIRHIPPGTRKAALMSQTHLAGAIVNNLIILRNLFLQQNCPPDNI